MPLLSYTHEFSIGRNRDLTSLIDSLLVFLYMYVHSIFLEVRNTLEADFEATDKSHELFLLYYISIGFPGYLIPFLPLGRDTSFFHPVLSISLWIFPTIATRCGPLRHVTLSKRPISGLESSFVNRPILFSN